MDKFITLDILKSFYIRCIDKFYIRKSEKGQANGIASLDGKGQIKVQQVPETLLEKINLIDTKVQEVETKLETVKETNFRINFYKDIIKSDQVTCEIAKLVIKKVAVEDFIIDKEGKIYKVESVGELTFSIDPSKQIINLSTDSESDTSTATDENINDLFG